LTLTIRVQNIGANICFSIVLLVGVKSKLIGDTAHWFGLLIMLIWSK
jgi:hypothetical protein